MTQTGGRMALETIPALLIEAEKVEADLANVTMRMRADINMLKTEPRGEFGGDSFQQEIDRLTKRAEKLRAAAQDRARTPNQMVFDLEV
jgi:hypothetical protein